MIRFGCDNPAIADVLGLLAVHKRYPTLYHNMKLLQMHKMVKMYILTRIMQVGLRYVLRNNIYLPLVSLQSINMYSLG